MELIPISLGSISKILLEQNSGGSYAETKMETHASIEESSGEEVCASKLHSNCARPGTRSNEQSGLWSSKPPVYRRRIKSGHISDVVKGE